VKILTGLLIMMLVCCSAWAGVEFDGTDDYVDCGSDASLEVADNFTISFWMKADTTGGWRGMVQKGRDDVNDYFGVWLSGTTLYFGTNKTDESANLLSGGSISTNIWYYITAVYDGINKRVYTNGILAGGPTAAGVGNSSKNLSIGRALGVSEYHDGQITEVAIWNTVLSAQQIKNLANSRVKGLPLQFERDNLMGYWPLDDEKSGTSGDGDTFRDLSGNANHGTGVDGANNTGLTCRGERLTYP